MNYLFDTNIVLGFLRQNSVAQQVSHILSLTSDNRIYISIVAAAELWSIANQNGWASQRRQQLQYILDDYIQLAISDDPLVVQYAAIDAFSQNKLMGRPLNTTARNMGKNDLWIAASASLAALSLVTTDKDFDHLHNQFVDVIWIDPNTTK